MNICPQHAMISKIEYHDFGQASVQKITTEFGQYVSFDAYWNLLCEFSDYEDRKWVVEYPKITEEDFE